MNMTHQRVMEKPSNADGISSEIKVEKGSGLSIDEQSCSFHQLVFCCWTSKGSAAGLLLC